MGLESKHDHGHTIAIAVGLGVGIPCLVTILVLIWVTIRHQRKMREEDEEHKEIDFNGDLSFFSPGRKMSESDMSRSHVNDDGESTFHSEQDMRPSYANMSSMIYTPDLANHSQETFSRTLNSVYGPSPMYPSTEKLKGPQISISGSSASMRSGNTYGSSYLAGPGPFATPPRRGSHPYTHYHEGRRASEGSIPGMPGVPATSQDPSYTAGGPEQLHQLNEVPHPYQDLVGNESHQSIANSAAELTQEDGDTFQEAPEISEQEYHNIQHPYHAEAANRQSTFEFQNQ